MYVIKMDLIQPRHSYADETTQWQIYTNTSLWTIWSILNKVWIDISLHDENFEKVRSLTSDTVWINLLWAPYVPVVIEMMERFRSQFGNDLNFILWWQVLTQKISKTWKTLGLDDDQFKKLFGKNVKNGMQKGVLEELCARENASDENNMLMIRTYEKLFEKNGAHGPNISLFRMYEKLSDEDFLQYFSREVSLYVSQWCKFSCDFCAAVKNQKEQYRDRIIMYQEICDVIERLQRLWRNTLDIYMTNLDVFQSPEELEWFADMMLEIKEDYPGFTFTLRGLAGTASFVRLDKEQPEVLEKLSKAGFTAVGYGVDGMWPEVWKWIKKPQNNEKDILDAIRVSKEKYNITPELLMVFGHVGVDTKQSLQHAYSFVEEMVKRYGAVPRPHVAKPFIPGNDGRSNPTFQNEVRTLIQYPHLFQSLDFTALASKLTHPDKAFRDLVNYYYLEMCKLPGNTTLPIIPYDIWDSQEVLEQKRIENLGKFDR